MQFSFQFQWKFFNCC